MRISDWSSDVCSSDLWADPGLLSRSGLVSNPQSRIPNPGVENETTHPRRRHRRSRPDRLLAAVPHRFGRDARQGPAGHPAVARTADGEGPRSEEHTSELQSLMRISYAVFCLKKKLRAN